MSTRKLLNIQDKNSSFEDSSLSEVVYKGIKYKFIKGDLSYTLSHCKACGSINESDTIYKNNTHEQVN